MVQRSHKHSYNAKSGAAIIIFQATGKLLHLGVCNKYFSRLKRSQWFIQLIFSGHWALSHLKEGVVCLYDTLQPKSLHPNVLKQMVALYDK